MNDATFNTALIAVMVANIAIFIVQTIIALTDVESVVPGILGIISFISYFGIYIYAVLALPKQAYNQHINRFLVITQVMYVLSMLGFIPFVAALLNNIDGIVFFWYVVRYAIRVLGFLPLIALFIQCMRVRRASLDGNLGSVTWSQPIIIGAICIALQICLFYTGPAFYIASSSIAASQKQNVNYFYGIFWSAVFLTLINLGVAIYYRRYAMSNNVYLTRRKRIHILIGLNFVSAIFTFIGAVIGQVTFGYLAATGDFSSKFPVFFTWCSYIQPIVGFIALVFFIVVADEVLREMVESRQHSGAATGIALKTFKSSNNNLPLAVAKKASV